MIFLEIRRNRKKIEKKKNTYAEIFFSRFFLEIHPILVLIEDSLYQLLFQEEAVRASKNQFT